MRRLLSRLLWMPPLVLLVATLTFFLMRAAPGGPFDRERAPASPEIEAAVRARYHLDEPLPRQYLRFLGQLARGDLGPSLKHRNHSVNDLLAQALPVSLALGTLALGVALALGIPAGVAGALYRGRWPDWLATGLMVAGVCVPSFVLAPLLVLVVGLQLRWLPVGLWGTWREAVLPALALGVYFAARISRLLREGLTEVLASPFIRTARAKGAGEWQVLVRHALRPALLPVVSYGGPLLADLLTGSFVVESVFQIPGTGGFFIHSFFSRDYPMMLGLVVLYSALLLALNLLVDLACARLDPRARPA